jgi:hypothetical protein
MKTTLDLPQDVLRELDRRAAEEARPVDDLVTELLRRGLGIGVAPVPISRSGRVAIAEDGLPVIRCGSAAPAARMTLEELLALEQDTLAEEDMERIRRWQGDLP